LTSSLTTTKTSVWMDRSEERPIWSSCILILMNADKKPIILGSRLQCLILYSLIILEQCMTLWGEREQTDIQDTEHDTKSTNACTTQEL